MEYERKNLPEAHKLSITMSLIMLTFTLNHWISSPLAKLDFSVLGIRLILDLNFQTVMVILAMIMAAAGSDWMMRGQGMYKTSTKIHATMQHWFMPMLTTLIAAITLNTLNESVFWWVIFGLGSLLLAGIFVAEYSAAAIHMQRQPFASILLIVLSHALFLVLSIAGKAAGFRLVVFLPVLVLASGLISLRTMYLRLNGQWLYGWAFLVMLVIGQLVVSFHYLRFGSLQYGLLITGLQYGLTVVLISHLEGRKKFALYGEGLVALVFTLVLAIVIN